VIDTDGFRPNVGLIIFNDEGKVLWAKRIGQDAWQFPQGGLDEGEDGSAVTIKTSSPAFSIDQWFHFVFSITS
jgi:hypothetical protein